MKRKKIVNFSFLAMFAGFLVALVGIFGNRVSADQAVAQGNGIAFLWIVFTVIGVVVVLIGLLGFLFAVASTDR